MLLILQGSFLHDAGRLRDFFQVIKNIYSKSDIYVERYCRTFFYKMLSKIFPQLHI
jgi:hypothetical protein